MNSNELKFNNDGKFTILQVSDPQDLILVRRTMLYMLNKAYDGIKPDLVLFTGDNTLGNHILELGDTGIVPSDSKETTIRRLRRALKHILKPVDDRGIPFAMIYGNHDDNNPATKEEQFELYKEYYCCLPMNSDDKTRDCDTYNITITASDSDEVKFNIWMLDSAWIDKEADKGYTEIKESAVNWYKETSDKLKAENDGKAVPSLMFMHVPLCEQKNFCMEVEPNYPGAIKNDDGKYIALNPAMANGVLGESVSAVDDDHGLFKAIKEQTDVVGVVSGHDHINCFDGIYDGVRFIQTGGASFRCYGNRIRGVRMFVLDEKNPEKFTTKYFNYDEICGNDFVPQFKYFISADDKMAENIAIGATVAGLTLFTFTKEIIKWRKKQKHR